MKFTKMHGLGNDYIYVNAFEERVHDPHALARAISDRHFGVGADGLIWMVPSSSTHGTRKMICRSGSHSRSMTRSAR